MGVEQAMGGTYPSSAKAIVNERSGAGFTLRSRWRPADVDPALVRVRSWPTLARGALTPAS